MKPKIYFSLEETVNLIHSLPYPVALLNDVFIPYKANRSFIVKTEIEAPIDSLLSHGELSLAFYNLNMLCENFKKYEDAVDSLYSINSESLSELYTIADSLKNGMLKLYKISKDIELLLRFMQEVWPIKREYYDFNTVINNIISQYKKEKGVKKATFILTANRDESVIYCDKMYMTKALLNIFINLLQLSSSENTTVHIDMNSTVGRTKLEIYSTRLCRFVNDVLQK